MTASLTVPNDILSESCILPQTVTIAGCTYDCQWYDVHQGSRGLVLIAARWSRSAPVFPGERWTLVRSRAREASVLQKTES